MEKLLKQNGYQLLGKKQKEIVIAKINGREHVSHLEAEYTVRKNGKAYVVVTAQDFDLQDPSTRSRLIAYDRVFGLNGLLAVDPEKEKIEEITFKFPRERDWDFCLQFISALFIIAAVVGIIWLLVKVGLL